MLPDSTAFNPYQAPTEGPTEAALAPDTEFLFNDQVVAGIGTIDLPRICIVDGSRDNLTARESRLWWCSRWITATRSLLMVPSVLMIIGILLNLLNGIPTPLRGGQFSINNEAVIFMGIASLLIALTGMFVIWERISRRSVLLRWHISATVIRRNRKRRIFGISILLMGIGALWIIPIFSAAGPLDGLPVLGWAIVAGIISVFLLKGQPGLYCVGKHDGLFLIAGFSPKFMDSAKQMVADYQTRISDPLRPTAPGPSNGTGGEIGAENWVNRENQRR